MPDPKDKKAELGSTQMLAGSESHILEMSKSVMTKITLEMMQQWQDPTLDGQSASEEPQTNTMAGLSDEIKKSGIAGPKGSLCAVTARGESGVSITRVCATVNPTNRNGAGLIFTGRFN